MNNIQSMYGLSSGFLLEHLFRQNLSPEQINSEFICGAELEIESVMDMRLAALTDKYIGVTEDGSLRNHGREFLLPPSTLENSVELFKFTHQCLFLGEEVEPFSERTSVHVHVNCMHSTQQQIKNLLYLYAIFEPLAFAFAGQERADNIHCVPLNHTIMPSNYALSLESLIDRWHKYTAFNLLPLRELGTVEFRHLGGTNDPVRYAAWLKFIKTLWVAAHKIDKIDKVTLLKPAAVLTPLYNELATPEFMANCLTSHYFRLEDNLLDVKLAFL